MGSRATGTGVCILIWEADLASTCLTHCTTVLVLVFYVNIFVFRFFFRHDEMTSKTYPSYQLSWLHDSFFVVVVLSILRFTVFVHV